MLIPHLHKALPVSGKIMRAFVYIISFLIYFSANGQTKFDSIQIDKLLMTLPLQQNQNTSGDIFIKAIQAVDKNYKTITDTLYRFKSLKHTILQTIYIETSDSIKINPLAFGDRLQTTNILFDNNHLNIKVDSIARKLKRNERNKFYKYLEENFDNFSSKEKKLNAQPVRIRCIKYDNPNFVNVGIDIYGRHFLWTIDMTKNWDVVKCESLWVY
jgi:hypothetical protein